MKIEEELKNWSKNNSLSKRNEDRLLERILTKAEINTLSLNKKGPSWVVLIKLFLYRPLLASVFSAILFVAMILFSAQIINEFDSAQQNSIASSNEIGLLQESDSATYFDAARSAVDIVDSADAQSIGITIWIDTLELVQIPLLILIVIALPLIVFVVKKLSK